MPTGPFLKAAVVHATDRLIRAFAAPFMVASAVLLAGCAGIGRPEPTQAVVAAKPPREALGDADIAQTLGLSRNTVRNHVAALYRKIGVRNRAALVVWARERGFTGVPQREA
jgi:Bacterial regulatory proteins, luxR family